MHTAVGRNHITDLSNFQSISSILKRFLHLTVSEPAKVTTMFMRGAIGMYLRQFRKFIGGPINLCLMMSQDFDGFSFRASDICLKKKMSAIEIKYMINSLRPPLSNSKDVCFRCV